MLSKYFKSKTIFFVFHQSEISINHTASLCESTITNLAQICFDKSLHLLSIVNNNSFHIPLFLCLSQIRNFQISIHGILFLFSSKSFISNLFTNLLNNDVFSAKIVVDSEMYQIISSSLKHQ